MQQTLFLTFLLLIIIFYLKEEIYVSFHKPYYLTSYGILPSPLDNMA